MSRFRDWIDRLTSWWYVKRIWGDRCSDYEPECVVCQKWREHDELFSALTTEGE